MDPFPSSQLDEIHSQNQVNNNNIPLNRSRFPEIPQQYSASTQTHSRIFSSSSTMPPPSTFPTNRRRKSGPQPIAPAPTPAHVPGLTPLSLKHLQGHIQQSSPSASVSSLSVDQDQDDDEYIPTRNPTSTHGTKKASTSSISTTVPAAGKRKQPPNSGTQAGNGKPNKMSREALRKANHSLIERRRREKINAALGELRRMVPGLGEDGGKAGEFKLEVLERTVSHMKDLKNHIIHLESIIADHGIDIPPMDDDISKRNDQGSDEDGNYNEDDDQTIKQDSRNSIGSSSKESTNVHTDIPTSFTYQQQHQNHTNGYQTHNRSRSNPYSPAQSRMFAHTTAKSHSLSPYPSPRPEHDTLNENGYDPNETEPETNLPPPLAKATRIYPHQHHHSRPISRPSSPPITTPSVASLLAQATHSNSPTPPPQQPISRPAPPPQSNNPIFLPFPAPSPTSPFLNPASNSNSSSNNSFSSGMSASNAAFGSSNASSSSYISDPSPFLAPIGGMSLFGGALNLDPPPPLSPADSLRMYNNPNVNGKQHSPPSLTLPPSNTKEKLKDMPPEEAANLLLAFSSPDVMRPQTQVNIYTNTNPADGSGKRVRSMTLENDDFELDSIVPYNGVEIKDDHQDGNMDIDYRQSDQGKGLRGKSAMDILRMSDSQR